VVTDHLGWFVTSLAKTALRYRRVPHPGAAATSRPHQSSSASQEGLAQVALHLFPGAAGPAGHKDRLGRTPDGAYSGRILATFPLNQERPPVQPTRSGSTVAAIVGYCASSTRAIGSI